MLHMDAEEGASAPRIDTVKLQVWDGYRAGG